MRKVLITIFFICFCISGYAQVQPDSTGNSKQPNYKPDILCVMPFQFTENGHGVGISYERSLDKRALFAFYIPAIITFNVANTNRIYDYNTGNYSTGKTDPMLYVMPGIKIYPTGGYGKIKYATGVSVVIGSGKQSSYLTNLNGLNTTELVQHHFLAGYMWQNSLNVNMDARIYLGAELGLGGTFINKAGGSNENNELLAQGALKIGYRF